MSKMMARWSEIVRLVLEMLLIWRSVDQVQDMSVAVGGEVDMLGQVAADVYIQKINCAFTVRGVNVDVKVAKE